MLVVCYRPSTSSDYDTFFTKLHELLDFSTTKANRVIFAGDFNIDMLTDSTHKNKFMDIVTCYGFSFAFHEPTRITSSSQTCIDNILYTGNIIERKIINPGLSDHTAQYVELDLLVKKEIHKAVYKRIMNAENTERFLGHLSDCSWNAVYCHSCPEKAFGAFIKKFTYIYDLNFPIKKLIKKPSCIIYPQYIITLKDKVSTLQSLSQKFPIFKQHFKEANAAYQKSLTEHRKSITDNQILSATNKNKAMWKFINSTIRETKKSTINITDNEDNNIDPLTVASNFNHFFINTVAAVNSTTDGLDYVYINSLIRSNNNSFLLSPVSHADIIDAIKNLKSSHSRGHDGISNNIIKICKDSICGPLAHIINASFEKSWFPSSLKHAIIKPLFKSGDKNDMSNYRPISLLSSFSKIFEIIINNKLLSFFGKYQLLSPTQHGFTKEKSVDTALFEFINRIYSTLDSGDIAIGVFVDLSKAFDCVDHSILLAKLERYGIRGNALTWFASYLSNRTQVVSIDTNEDQGIKSESLPNDTGVPQGSISGPLLFNIYANDLPECLKELPFEISIISYADDNNFLIKLEKTENLSYKLQLLYDTLSTWITKNKLKMNTSKSVFTIFQTSRSSGIQEVASVLKETDTIKMLGLQLNCNLKWDVHISNLCKKLNKALYGIRIMSQKCRNYVLKTLYFANFHSLLRYGIIHWGSASDCSRVFTIQKRAIRVLAKLQGRDSCRDAFKNLGILTVPSVYILESLIFIYKHYTSINTQSQEHGHFTRNKDLIKQDKHRLALYEKSAKYNAIKMFNALPDDIKKINNLISFKRTIKNLLLHKTLYSLEEFYSEQLG